MLTVVASRVGVHLDQVEDLQVAASSIFVPLQIKDLAKKPFHAIVRNTNLGPVTLTRIQHTPATVLRRPRLITSTDPDLVKVTLHRRGQLIVSQDDKQSVVRPGDLIAYETSRPYQLIGNDRCDLVVIGLSRLMLGPGADLITRRTVTAIPSDRGTRSLIAGFLSDLLDTTDEVPAHAGIRLADALASLIMTVFADTTAERVDARTELTDRIIVYALANLGDPTLSVESVARRHGVSARHVHKLLQRRGMTFAAWLKRERLHRIRRDLIDPAYAHRTTAAIAARWGIFDPDHLGRAFKAEFGHTAANIRRSRLH
ncbi:AraC family transcriptional regulator [Sphaerisporangium melleum]|uniref:AraC family transcriptional regulator n=1 Tax=Sphaerisporangium melleum TaxID=321316 RepID=A0A917R752_9ACTN|nr:helix-turn-helix domain-containing protein [Sphaerisporangium melleum]GGK92894.1 AraC family transcriptional regulator [Sphaerisporangium melleum]GII73471.1 AraC family transcriptional regulator [Sphaerisporangium melleum]